MKEIKSRYNITFRIFLVLTLLTFLTISIFLIFKLFQNKEITQMVQGNLFVTKKLKNESTVEAASNQNANLQTLAIENAVLFPELTEQTTNYTASVTNDVTSLNILAVPENENATVKIEGEENLKEGDNEVIVTVFAENDATSKKYRIHVTRETMTQKEEEETKKEENAKQLKEIIQNLEQNQEGILQTEIEEHNKKNNENSSDNITENILIDNSKELAEEEKTKNNEENQNSLFIIGGVIIVLTVIGIIVIVWKKKITYHTKEK